MTHFLQDFLTPESIAVYGANNKGGGIGSIQLMGLIITGFKGRIYPIHLKLDSVMGFKAYKSILDVPEVPDLVLVVLPPKVVPQVFEECGQKGVKRIILISGGFRELTGDNKNSLREEIQKISDKYDMRFIGPNCLGIYNSWIYPEDDTRALNTAIWEKQKRGYFSIASQSGTLASHIFFDPDNLDLGISRSLSLGNEADIDIVDCLEYYKDDDKTKVIGLYIEELKRAKRFLKLAKEITPDKPIVTIYVGGSNAAKRAVKSHTGSLAGNSRIYDAAFKEAGIIKTELVEEYLDIARILTKGILPNGKRIGIITNSGGPGVMIANHAEKSGLKVPILSNELQDRLKEFVIPTASLKNPIDTTFDMNFQNYYINIPKTLMKSGEIDALMVYGAFGFQDVLRNLLENERIAKYEEFPEEVKKDLPIEKFLVEPILKVSKRYSIPIFFINPQNYNSPWSKKIRSTGAILFKYWDNPVRCLTKICEYSEYINKRR
ncbi:MAG: CoA-binding protein [Candidatus Lokiarchaeota archaeon]|nr:CoA-binding protein [Candidatus Lokiarchaeota archaeon]MBD3202321.1 CoA-binding protein [Candidatus Lokiarchaeota archaeon]